ncbi:hypothetical protein JOB18_035298, partial [Solea senegalensis]
KERTGTKPAFDPHMAPSNVIICRNMQHEVVKKFTLICLKKKKKKKREKMHDDFGAEDTERNLPAFIAELISDRTQQKHVNSTV